MMHVGQAWWMNLGAGLRRGPCLPAGGPSSGDRRPQHRDDLLGDLLLAAASVEGGEVASEAHGGDGVLVDVGGHCSAFLELRQHVFDESDAWFDCVLAKDLE